MSPLVWNLLQMTIAQGRNNVITELDILKETLENMVQTIESQYRDIVDSIKANIFDIEHDVTLSAEEQTSLSLHYYRELNEFTTQQLRARNNLFICIYSICEVNLATICETYKITVIKNFSSRKSNQQHNKKRTYYYLKDYLCAIDPSYLNNINYASIVCGPLKELRDYLIHSKPDVITATKITHQMHEYGFSSITHNYGQIIINNESVIHQILEYCVRMLISAEQIAKSKSQSNNQ